MYKQFIISRSALKLFSIKSKTKTSKTFAVPKSELKLKNSFFLLLAKDLVLDQRKSDHIVESWIGEPTLLKCVIRRNVILATNYKWNVVSDSKDIRRGIIRRGGNRTSYAFTPLSDKDFGKYKCTIKTEATTVEHEILLNQIRMCLTVIDIDLNGTVVYIFIYRGYRYYTAVRRNKFYLRVVKTIFYGRAQRVSKILFSPQEDKIHIFKPPCNVLFII